MDMTNAQNVQIKPLTIRALEKLQLEITRQDLEDALVKAHYGATEGEWNISDFKFVTVKYINNDTHAVYDITLKGEGWTKSDTIQLPFDAETGELRAFG